MPFEFGDDDLRCRDCAAPISRTQYARKVPRCDQCEGDSWLEVLNAQLERWNRAAGEHRP
jgi:hypothetical protein